MSKPKIDIGKIVSWYIGFAIARILFDYFLKGVIDFYGVIGIPLIAVGLIYLIDKKQFLKEDK